jgi:hypothetical protein
MSIDILKNYIQLTIKSSKLLEGKAAAVRMLPRFGMEGLEYSPLTDKDMNKILPSSYGEFPGEGDSSLIGDMLYKLGTQGLIDTTVAPRMKLGSTRLAAMNKYKDPALLEPGESPETVTKAGKRKKSYGDIDIDVVFLAPPKQVAAAISQIDPSAFQTMVTAEIHIAVRVGNKVYQVDLVDLGKSSKGAEFLQSSSFIDLSQGIKGVFQTELIRSVVATMKPELTIQHFQDWVTSNPNTDFSNQWSKLIKCAYTPNNVRLSLTKVGLQILVDFEKPGRKEGTVTRKGVKCPVKPLASFEDKDELAQVILDDPGVTFATIYSAISLAQHIGSNFPQDKVDTIWEAMLSRATKGALARVDQENLDTGLGVIAGIFGKTYEPFSG